VSKAEIYKEVKSQILAVLDGEPDVIAQMSTVACLLSHAFPEAFFWTGFYIVDQGKKDELVVGPYQGTLGCLRIKFGRGVCGTAAASQETQVVDDVNALANHIACDSRSQSEIVVPVISSHGDLIAVLDIDSTELAAFDSVDKAYLENIISAVFRGE